MTIYPWLKKIYKIIINQHISKKLHHAVLIRSRINVGSKKLIFQLCKKILCKKSKKIFSCNICHYCKLIDSKNHPDLNIITPEINKKSIGIETIIKYIKKIQNTSKFGKKTIIWIPKVHLLTESSINSFLKILEDPPLKTIFFLDYCSLFKLKKTFKSRCIIYDIYPPIEKKGICWLKKKKNYKEKNILTALRLSDNSPILAKKIFHSSIWEIRKKFYKKIKKYIKKKNLFKLIKHFKKNTSKKIYWIFSLILDVIKYYYNKNSKIINLDQKKLIKIIKKKNNLKNLYFIINLWKKCFFYIKNIPNVNIKFILLEPLIQWEKIFNFL
ncbi:MAG: DNA polymerase III subunit delta' [Buchnera aphidicola (Periphyllus acericola)]|uniref:DNA polymerase III subunit delta' C-terminal domain-containing protein n=1 Tax=Buchnera aphidicola TaxID=9 RepID=UPI0030D4A3AE|nr:DNA polymerase III subunit delta' [Buchnera aphidicola (Periphyllus acericola)]